MSLPSISDLEIVKNMKDAQILVVGDIMLDKYVYGHVDRISPESPVPVLSVKREDTMLGGAGNTLFNIVNLGCGGRLLSVIGDDDEGAVLQEKIARYTGDAHGLVVSSDHQTIVKTRFLAGHQQLLRTDFEQVKPITQKIEKELLVKAETLIKGVNVMILSDYGKGVLTAHLVKSLIALAKSNNVRVLVDPKGVDYSLYRGADIVTPNKKELSEATGGLLVDNDDQVVKACERLITQSGIASVVATRSKDGMSVIGQDLDAVHIRSVSDIEVFDVSGAGDTVIATMAASMAAGADIVQAASLANIAGRIVVSKVGTAPIRAAELVHSLEQQDHNQPKIERARQAPLLDWDNAREEVQRWKARGLKVGFTNGCFDILHLGHVTYLNDARRKCDRLVVGVNCDESVKILKGESRPVHDEQSRAAVLAALGSVDMVVYFGAKQFDDDNTACALINALQPDLYFKGGDYTLEQIPETPTVHKYGGVVEVMPVCDGHSTTQSIQKIANNKVV